MAFFSYNNIRIAGISASVPKKVRYIRDMDCFAPGEPTVCTEIGDGNINYVFRVVSEADGHSVIVKQADRLLRSSGRPLDMYRNKIEAAILRLEGELAPGMVPEVWHYDEVMAATSMEDISDYKNLKDDFHERHS